MPTDINRMFIDVLGRKADGEIKWSQIMDSNIPRKIGVYVISLNEPVCSPEFCDVAISQWMNRAANMTIDGLAPTIESIKTRLSGFWYRDEIILYIGQTSRGQQNLRRRLRQFYNHQLGNGRPHSGGLWIKTLSNINHLNVHWAIVENGDPYKSEQEMLGYFLERVSEESRQRLFDQDLPIPFANLKYKNIIKKHGFRNQTI